MKDGMDELVKIYECFCDRTRLRLLNLLLQGPQCVCHLQDILGEPQVKISKHLAYLKDHGMVEVRREGNWRIYSLPAKRTPVLQANLACLQDCATEDKVFRSDATKLRARTRKRSTKDAACCASTKATC